MTIPDATPTFSYQQPPAPIPDILATRPTPSITLSPTRRHMALLDRASLPPIADLAEPELKLAGIRINPRTRGPSRQTFFYGITIEEVLGTGRRRVPLPDGVRLSLPRWSPDGTRLAFLNTVEEGIELWVVEVATGHAERITEPRVSAVFGGVPYEWAPDGEALYVALVPEDPGEAPAAPGVPAGPVVQENRGETRPARTYQDLLASEHDERLFEHYFQSVITRVPLSGSPVALTPVGVHSDFGVSPSGDYLQVERIRPPYSYLVPYHRFPLEVLMLTSGGREVRTIAQLPLAEDVPIAFDAVPRGPRSFQWRADAPSTLLWVEALDGGDPRTDAELRDRVFTLDAPFTGDPRVLLELEYRYAGVLWGREDLALVYSRWWDIRRKRIHAVDPSGGTPPRVVLDRSWEERYHDPGTPVLHRNEVGRSVLLFSPEGSLYLEGDGASPRGDYPFLDRWDLETGETQRLWRAEDPFYEQVVTVLDTRGPRVLTRRESPVEPPNFHVRDLSGDTSRPLTHFPDPAPQLEGLGRRLITYARADGVKMSATLYTPPGHDPERDGPLPTLLWAYPREFRDADAAGQVDDSPNRFSRPSGASHLFLLTQGYAILDGPAMPIIGEGDEEPNDRYVEQLVENARAAVEAIVELGVADRERIGVGGHSYGAFMTANLLAHTDLFRAGIARSGAYNRTLTPFGFQSEQRTYWQATETYTRMSPFTYAHQIRAPLLLIHGEADNNPGTYPLQSERLYHALKGLGATTRYVVLPLESHSYQARESVLHVHAEMIAWMDRYVKGEAD